MDSKVPAQPGNPLDTNQDGVIDSTDVKELVKRTVPVLVSWLMWYFFNRKK